jgi:peroxiredoxin Q/BCP
MGSRRTRRSKVGVGDTAPDFTLPSQSGEEVSFRDFLGRKKAVVLFYPKDDTPGCTKEACSFGDEHERFGNLEAQVKGVSSHQRFAQRHDLPFVLLSGEGAR